MRKLTRLTTKASSEYGMIGAGDRVMVCLSGGKDSYTLLDVLLTLQQHAPFRFELVAVNLDQRQPGFPEEVLPAYLSDRGAMRSMENAIKDRLPGELAGTVWTDPLTSATSLLGEDRAAFAARLGQGAGSPQVARLRDRLEQKKGELEARQRDLEGRRTEKWVALGSAVLSNIGLFTGRKRTISGAGTVVSKNRMEGTAEARVEALKAEIAELEQDLAAHSSVDPARLQSTTVVPTRTQVKLLRYGLVWVY